MKKQLSAGFRRCSRVRARDTVRTRHLVVWLPKRRSPTLFIFHHGIFLKVCLPPLRCLISLSWPSFCKKNKKNPRETINRETQPKNNLLLWNNQRLNRAQTRKSGDFYSVLCVTLRRISFLLSLRTSLSTLWLPRLCPPRASDCYVSSHTPFQLSP